MNKIKINTDGQQARRGLTDKIGEVVGVAPIYTGAGGNVIEGERFRFSYVVMNITIAQDCTIVWDERTDDETMNRVFDGLAEAGYEFDRPAPTEESAAEPEMPYFPEQPHEDWENCAEDFREIDGLPPKRHTGIMDVIVDAYNEQERESGNTGNEWTRLHSAPTIIDERGREHNLDGTFASAAPAFEDLKLDEREELGLGRTRREDPQGENGMSADDVPDTITIELPTTNIKPEILTALINSKATLITAALGEDAYWYSPENPGPWYGPAPSKSILPIEFDEGEGKVRFEWLKFGADSDAVAAWSAFLAAAVKFSKTAKRVTAKDGEVENQKFAFRTFMVKIGMNDAENKAHRRYLLRNLKGDSAFATPESKAKWQFKHGKPATAEEVVIDETAE